MGSVQSGVECPECKYPNAMEDYYYKSNEVYVFCDNCGYHYSRNIRRNDKSEFILRCSCGHEGIAKTKKVNGKNRNYCGKCNKWLKSVWDYLIYDEVKEKGKGSMAIAGIIFTCPKCKTDCVPYSEDGRYSCKNKECGAEFDDETAKKMLKRKKISGIQSVMQIPDIPDKENKVFIEELRQREDIVITRLSEWNGEKWKEK